MLTTTLLIVNTSFVVSGTWYTPRHSNLEVHASLICNTPPTAVPSIILQVCVIHVCIDSSSAIHAADITAAAVVVSLKFKE